MIVLDIQIGLELTDQHYKPPAINNWHSQPFLLGNKSTNWKPDNDKEKKGDKQSYHHLHCHYVLV